MRVLGVDPGEVRVGLAISDPRGLIAVPLGVYTRVGAADPEEIAAVAVREEAELIVVGLPLSSDGSVGTQARLAQRLAHAIERAAKVPVVFWDERFSTQQAGRAMIQGGTSRKRRRRGLDAAAAAIILQEYLDCHRQPDDPNS
jgi:putative Holliday junction resolvase